MVQICANSEMNKMNSSNLAIVIGPNILRSETQTMEIILNDTPLIQHVVETLIDDHQVIFSKPRTTTLDEEIREIPESTIKMAGVEERKPEIKRSKSQKKFFFGKSKSVQHQSHVSDIQERPAFSIDPRELKAKIRELKEKTNSRPSSIVSESESETSIDDHHSVEEVRVAQANLFRSEPIAIRRSQPHEDTSTRQKLSTSTSTQHSIERINMIVMPSLLMDSPKSEPSLATSPTFSAEESTSDTSPDESIFNSIEDENKVEIPKIEIVKIHPVKSRDQEVREEMADLEKMIEAQVLKTEQETVVRRASISSSIENAPAVQLLSTSSEANRKSLLVEIRRHSAPDLEMPDSLEKNPAERRPSTETPGPMLSTKVFQLQKLAEKAVEEIRESFAMLKKDLEKAIANGSVAGILVVAKIIKLTKKVTTRTISS